MNRQVLKMENQEQKDKFERELTFAVRTDDIIRIDKYLANLNINELYSRSFIDRLLKNGFVPIISPISYGIHGETLNINADTFASHVSVATNSQRLVFITDVMGILRKDGAIIKSITTKEAKKLIDEEVVANGMIPKVKGGIYAAGNGVKEVIIGTFGDEAGFNIEGTIIRREDDEES